MKRPNEPRYDPKDVTDVTVKLYYNNGGDKNDK